MTEVSLARFKKVRWCGYDGTGKELFTCVNLECDV